MADFFEAKRTRIGEKFPDGVVKNGGVRPEFSESPGRSRWNGITDPLEFWVGRSLLTPSVRQRFSRIVNPQPKADERSFIHSVV